MTDDAASRVKALLQAPTSLYKFYGADDELLYVGISVDFDKRRAQHRGDKFWWPEVARWTVDQHPNRLAAAVAERDAIIAGLPRYNYTHHPDKQASSAVRGYGQSRVAAPLPATPQEELADELDWMIDRFGIPAEHAEIIKREALDDLEMVGHVTTRRMPMTVTKSEYQDALAMQAKRRARQLPPTGA